MGAEDRRVIGSRPARAARRSAPGSAASARAGADCSPRARCRRVRRALGGEHRGARVGLDHLVAEPDPQHALEHVPSLVVGVVDVKRGDPLKARIAGICPLDHQEVAVLAADLTAARDVRNRSSGIAESVTRPYPRMDRVPPRMAVKTEAIGKTYEPSRTRSAARRSASTPRRSARPTLCTSTSRPPARPATPTWWRHRCSRSSTPRERSGRWMFDPEVGINFAMLVHGGQEFAWGPVVVAGDEVTHDRIRQGHLGTWRDGVLRVRVGVGEPARGDRLHGHVDEDRQGRRMSRGRHDRAEGHAGPVRHRPLRGRVGRLQPDPHR